MLTLQCFILYADRAIPLPLRPQVAITMRNPRGPGKVMIGVRLSVTKHRRPGAEAELVKGEKR